MFANLSLINLDVISRDEFSIDPSQISLPKVVDRLTLAQVGPCKSIPQLVCPQSSPCNRMLARWAGDGGAPWAGREGGRGWGELAATRVLGNSRCRNMLCGRSWLGTTLSGIKRKQLKTYYYFQQHGASQDFWQNNTKFGEFPSPAAPQGPGGKLATHANASTCPNLPQLASAPFR